MSQDNMSQLSRQSVRKSQSTATQPRTSGCQSDLSDTKIHKNPHHWVREVKLKISPLLKEWNPNADQKHKKKTAVLQMVPLSVLYTLVEPRIDEIKEQISSNKPVIIECSWAQGAEDGRSSQMHSTQQENGQKDDGYAPDIQFHMQNFDLTVFLFTQQKPSRTDKENIIAEKAAILIES